MNGTEIGKMVIQGMLSGILQGLKIMLPYIISFCVICVLIGVVKRHSKKRKK